MKQTRLTQNHRSLMYALVEQIVDCPAEIKAEQTAYARAMPLAFKVITKTFNQEDMKVFQKYDRARRDKCVRIQHPDGSIQEFTFKEDDAPYVPSGSSCRSQIYLSDERQATAIERWVSSKKELEEATEKKRNEYRAFIENATYFEQVVEVWPEAMQLSDRIRINLPAAVSPDMLARIKADSEARMKRKIAA